MIQVIERVFGIIEMLSKEETLRLRELAEAKGLNKATLCNILKTLVDLGYVEKRGDSQYALSEKFQSLAYSRAQKSSLLSIAEEHANELASETRESGTVTVLHNGQAILIAKAVYNQSVIINTDVFNNLTLLKSASGKILLAFQDEKTINEILKKELSGASLEVLKRELKAIRREKFTSHEVADRQAYAFAVPVFGPDNTIAAALGICIPSNRYTESHNKEIKAALDRISEKMSYIISLI
ncbi:MAG: hypothetical protein A2017_01845 [Lentisphaerae bacterium GWF2_44_16]|nr:MAG: hypothetical protein A2017_01845 [Lentisphaerae bacterium GWF2_44_16]